MTNYRSKKPKILCERIRKNVFLLDKTKKTFSWSNENGLKPNETERRIINEGSLTDNKATRVLQNFISSSKSHGVNCHISAQNGILIDKKIMV